MSDRNYYVLCDDDCRFPAMTAEQVLAAIAEATGNTPTSVDNAFITKILEQNKNKSIKLWIGTEAEYNALEATENDVIYILTDAEDNSEMIRIATEIATEKVNEVVPIYEPVNITYTYDNEKTGDLNRKIDFNFVFSRYGRIVQMTVQAKPQDKTKSDNEFLLNLFQDDDLLQIIPAWAKPLDTHTFYNNEHFCSPLSSEDGTADLRGVSNNAGVTFWLEGKVAQNSSNFGFGFVYLV